MATPAEIETQVKFEREAISQGLKKLHKNTQDLEEKSYASATIYGVASIDTALPGVIKHIEDTVHDRLIRGTGHNFQLVKQYVSKLDIKLRQRLLSRSRLIRHSHVNVDQICLSTSWTLSVRLLKQNVRCGFMSKLHLGYSTT